MAEKPTEKQDLTPYHNQTPGDDLIDQGFADRMTDTDASFISIVPADGSPPRKVTDPKPKE